MLRLIKLLQTYGVDASNKFLIVLKVALVTNLYSAHLKKKTCIFINNNRIKYICKTKYT